MATDRTRRDVTVDASTDTSVGEVLARIAESLDEPSVAESASMQGIPLDPHRPIGASGFLDGALLTVPADHAEQVLRPAALSELRVIGGPGAGARRKLAPGGAAVIGRGADADLRLDDPAVSRRHALVRCTPTGITVTDRGSTNGTDVGGERLGNAEAAVPAGVAIRVGSSLIVVGGPDTAPVALATQGDGTLRHNRPPRLRTAKPEATVTFPAAPPLREATRFSVVTLIAPIAVGIALAAVMRRPEYLLFTLLSPAMMAGQWLADRRGTRRSNTRERMAHKEATALATGQLQSAIETERSSRRRLAPDATSVERIASLPTRRLWERRRADPDFLLLRLGLHDAPSRITIAGNDAPAPQARAVPLTIALSSVGVLGIAGPAARVGALARFVTGHVAALHSPRDVSLVVLTTAARANEWAWMRWLPHSRATAANDCDVLVGLDAESVAARVAELLAVITARSAEAKHERNPDRSDFPAVVVIVDGARQLRRTPGLTDVLSAGPPVGVYAMCLDIEVTELPEECGASAVLCGDNGTELTAHVSGSDPMTPGIADGVSHAWIEHVARSLAPIRDNSPAADGTGTLPNVVRWLDVAEPAPARDLASWIAESWASGPTSRALLGVGDEGPFAIDLAHDGPHGLVAGTTGSGKSELLQTLVASLAAANRPDDMTFVLIDYKGGAAFGACERLPHTVGFVTDLDGALIERALVSLTAELRRREGLLADAGARDIDAYRGAGQRLARLVIVVDEFASLAEELPAFVDGLVGVAQRGRSLGVHLVLATQRPEGVVSADIRANANLRLCLAVTREAESRDVIDTPDAAHISRHTPGRGYARTGHRELRAFQTGRVSGPAQAPEPTRGPFAWPAPFAATARRTAMPSDEPKELARTDLDELVAACAEATRCLGIEPPASPWLPPLPAIVPVGDIDVPATSAVLGLQDLPAAQSRRPLAVTLGGPTGLRHLLVAGGPRSGRSTALRTLAGSLAALYSPQQLHLYALDYAAGGLVCLEELPHCGAVITAAQPDRVRRLLAVLTSDLTQRSHDPAGDGAANPHVVVLLDSWEAFATAFDTADGADIADAVQRLLRDGPARGVHLVISSDRTGLTGRLATLIDARLVLRLTDRADFALAGIPASAVPSVMPPGRGVWADGAIQTQVCVLGEDVSAAGQAAEISRIAQAARAASADEHGAGRPRHIEPLPDAIALSEIAALWPAEVAPTGVRCVLGVGGDELATVTFDLAQTGAGFVISGPPGSGRSTTLATLACQLAATGRRVVAVTPRVSALPDSASAAIAMTVTSVSETDAAERLARDLTDASEPLAVLVDDAELVADSAVGAVLDRFAKSARDGGHLLVVAGTPEDLAVGFRGFAVDARRSRCGIVLAPRGPLDGELLGVRLPRAAVAAGVVIPGRGLAVVRGEMTAVQVALPG